MATVYHQIGAQLLVCRQLANSVKAREKIFVPVNSFALEILNYDLVLSYQAVESQSVLLELLIADHFFVQVLRAHA